MTAQRQPSRRLQSRTLGQGFVPLVRSVEAFEQMRDPVAFTVYAMIAIRARYHTAGRDGLEVGQMVLGRASLAAEMRLTEGQIRAALGRLQNTGHITTKATSRGTVVTILKTSVFDCGSGDNDRPGAGFVPAPRPTSRRVHAAPAATNEEGKEGKNLAGSSPMAVCLQDGVFLALAQAEGSVPASLTKSGMGAIAKALADIRSVCPEVTAEEVARRAGEYRRVMPGGSKLTACALAKQWARCGGRMPTGEGGTAQLEPPDWRRLLEQLFPGNAVSGDLGRTWASVDAATREKVMAVLAEERGAA